MGIIDGTDGHDRRCFSRNDGSLCRPLERGVVVLEPPQHESRVSSSEGRQSRALEGWQPVTNFHPADVVAQPE